MRWPLRYQILTPYAGLLLVALALVSVSNAYLAARRTERQIERQARDITDTLGKFSFPLTQTVLEHVRGLSGFEFAITSRDGNVRAATAKTPSVLSTLEAVAADAPLRLGPTIELDGENYFRTAVELEPRDPREEAMTLHLLYPERTWREARWQAAAPALAIGAIALCVAIGLAFVIAARVSQPVARLRKQMSRLSRGDFEPVPPPPRDDEMRDLALSANALAARLDELGRVIQRSERLALLGQLGAGLAHSLRNDITGAKLAVQLHERRCQGVDQESLEIALRQLTLTETHLQRFLAIGQPKPPSREALDFREAIEGVVAMVEPTCRHRKVSLEVDLANADDARLSADPEQLRQALLNLIVNAVEAAGVHGWVKIELIAGERETLKARIFDSGPGLSESVRERLFEPFASAKPEGVGLGLAVARQIAEAHGGSVTLAGENPTCFELSLPAPSRRGAAISGAAT